MKQDLCELLLEAIDTMQQTVKTDVSALQNQFNSISITEQGPVLLIANPFNEILQQEKIQFYENSGISIQPGEVSNVSSWQLSDQGKYDRLGIEFLVTTSAIDNIVPMGDYGATVVVYGSNKIYTAEFSSVDMLGDVYNFNNMLQKQIFDITDVKNILFIALQFYNRSNIPVIFKNVSLCVGYDLNSYGPNSEPLILYGETDNQEYITNAEGVVVENTEQILCARFIYNENGVYKAITHNNPDLPAGISVRWYRYSASTAQGDQYGGAYWSYMPFTETEQQAGYNIMRRMVTNFNPTEEFEQFKIVVLKSNFADNSIASYTSNIITLANHKQALENLLTETGIVFEDGTDGIYPLYAFDQKIIPDQLFQTLIKRYLSLKYKTTLTERELYSHLVKVTWKLPADHMFFAFDEMAEKNILADNYMSCYMVDEFHPLNDEVADEDIAIWLKDLFTIPYTIANERVANIDNMVICEIELDDGITYLFEKDVSFTTQGSGGTDNSVLVRLIDGLGRDQSAIIPGAELFLQPRIFNVDGEDITKKTTISAEFKVNTGVQNELTLGTYDNELGVIPISAANDKIDNILAIVKITFTFIENNLQLEELVPITIASSNNIVYRGPVAVMYNSAGNSPEYNHNNLTLYKDTILVEPLWSSLYVDSTYIKNYPKLNGSAFIPKNTFDKSMEIGYGIKATWNNDTDYFIQPIPIYQNKYFARIINEWDGALEINEEGNYILASSYVAGGKNDANQFTGVILGETGTITETDITDKETGVFGYKEGVQTFGVRSDGTAFMGRAGDGRILIDGEDGIIYSGNFDGFKTVVDENGKENIDYKQLNETSTQGTYLNLKDGTFITNEGLFRGALRSEDLQVGNGEDINIVFNNDEEYIQSDDYELNEDGSAKSGLRIDLQKGSIHSPYFSTNNNGAMFKGQMVVEGGYWYEDKDGNIIEAPYKIENYYLKNSDPYTVPSQNDASWNVNEPIIESGEYIWQKNVKKYYGKNDEVVIFRITGIDGIVGGDGPAGESAYSIDVQEDFAAIFLTNNESNVAIPDIPLRILYGSEPVAIARTNIYAEEDFNINALAQNAYALRVTLNNLVFPAQTTSNTDELRANLTINNSTKVITISNIVLPANNTNGTINFAYGKRVGNLFSIVASGLFEVITYVNGKDGNAIVDIIEYYKATDTQIAPDIDNSWVTSIEKAGQSKTRPFLWNYEKTLYSHTEETITDVCLLSSTPRVIETITEYYAIVDGLTTNAPAAPTLSNDGNSINENSLRGWDTNNNLTPQEGQALWNCEIIKYGAVDAKGKNLYQVTPPARIGYVGQNGTDGKGVAIKGTAYVPKGTIIQQNQVYTIYIDEACETVLTAVEDGDAYLVTDQLFVYAGYNNENDEPQFLCVGTIQGPAGKDGVGINIINNYYMASSRKTGVIAGSEGEREGEEWVLGIIPELSEEKPYLWNYEVTAYVGDKEQDITSPAIIGYWNDGISIKEIKEYYCITPSTFAPEFVLEEVENILPEDGAIKNIWYSVNIAPTSTNRYLWNYERVIYSGAKKPDGFGPSNIGVYGKQGNDAVLYRALADSETIKRVQQIDEAGNISYRYILPNGAINVVMQRIEGQNGPIIDTTNFQWAFGNVLIESGASFSLTAEKLEQLPQDPEITYATLVVSKKINGIIIELDKILFNFIEDGSPGSDVEETVVITYQLYCTTDEDEINKIYAPDKYPPLPTTKFDGSDYNDGEVYWIGGTTSPIEINPNGNFNANGEDIWIWTSTYQYMYKKSTPNDGEYSYTAPTLLNSNTQVVQWCIKNGKTVINDSEIYTGGVIADSLTGRVLKSLNWYEGTVSGHGDVNQQGGIYTLDYSYSYPGINYNHVECKIILNPRKYYENGQLIDTIGTVERECTFTGTNVNTISQNDYYWYKIEDVNNSYYYFYQDSTFSEKISDEYLYYNNNTMFYTNSKYGLLLPAPLARDSNLHIIEGSQYDLNNGTMTTPGFTLDKYGNATFSGTVNAYQGKMAGWDIQRDGLYHNKNGTTADIYLGTDGISVDGKLWTFKVSSNFRVSLQGELYTASGQLGRWNIGNDGIYYAGLGTRNNPDVYLGAGLQLEDFFGIEDTKWTLKAGDKFGVTQDGTLYAANANILAGSTIAGWTTSENIFGKLSPYGGTGFYYGISLNANNIGTKDAPVLAIGLMLALDNINNNALSFMVDGHGYAKAKHLIAETGQIGEWIIADSGPLQYNSTQSLLSMYAQTNNSAYLGKEEIHIATPPQAVTDTDSYQYYTVLKPGAIINTMDPYGSHTGDIATILEARELKFLDLRGLTNKRLKNYDLTTLPDDINTNAGNGIYGYIGLPSSATGSNRASRGLIENFDIHAGAGGTVSTIGTDSEPFSTIYTQKLYIEGYEISWVSLNGFPYINFQGVSGIMINGKPI